MIQWLLQYSGTALVVLVIALVLMLIIRGMYRDKKAGKCACGGSCSSCGGGCHTCVSDRL